MKRTNFGAIFFDAFAGTGDLWSDWDDGGVFQMDTEKMER
jgi:hypothetical protein